MKKKQRKARRGVGIRTRLIAKPTPAFDLVEKLAGFETAEGAEKERAFRIKALEHWLSRREVGRAPFYEKEVKGTLSRLQKRAVQRCHADPRYMRRLRRRYVGQVWSAAEKSKSQVRVYTVIPTAWRVRAIDLPTAKGKRFLEQFRSHLNRAGSALKSGHLTAFLHASYDRQDDYFQFHVHVIAVGEKIEVIEKLRQHRALQKAPSVSKPIQKAELNDPAEQFSYWGLQQTFTLKEPGSSNYDGRKRLPSPRFAESLIWFGKQRFVDLVLLHGCELKKGIICERKRSRTNPENGQ